MSFDISSIRGQFPILSTQIDGPTFAKASVGKNPLIYLDSAATAQKPQAVLDRMNAFYQQENANPHRGMHVLAERATVAYEDARKTVQTFIRAARPEEIIFTKSCTEAINLVAISLSRGGIFKKGDAVVLSMLEHHSNIVPWLQLKERKGIEILWLDCDPQGQLNIDQLKAFLKKGNVKLVSVTAQSNVLGVRPPLHQIITAAHEHKALVLVDAAQSIAHHQADVQELDCDFLTFSGHKLYGPSGVGVLYGKMKLLESMPPFLGGGMMIQEVTQDRFTSADLPQKFEAGTPPVAEAVGLAAAIDWLTQYSWKDIEAHEASLLKTASDVLGAIPGLTILGPSPKSPVPSSGCVSFTLEGIHPHDLTDILGRQGICLRAGHHCTQPLHRRLGIPASTRLSVAIYNTKEEIIATGHAIVAAITKFQH